MMMCPQVCSQGQAECPEFRGGGGEGGHGQLQPQLGGGQQRDQGHRRHRHVRGEAIILLVEKEKFSKY